MTSPSESQARFAPFNRRRAGRRFTSVAMLATMAVMVGPVVQGGGDADRVGNLSPSMVEMLSGSDSSKPVSLEKTRKAVEAYLDTKGLDGTGIDVAVIDTGVAPVEGLGPDKVLHGPDLSFEGASREVAFLDTYGHGTHMAGIIAGDRDGDEGLAPGARIISLKTAGHDGITTVPQVVAAIDWVVEHRNSDGLNIRVLNLSLGQVGVPTHVGDYLSAAVERAWHAGIFVVVAAGNEGKSQIHLDSPAIDPYVMAVGAQDYDKGKVATFTAYGDGTRNPDIVAPGQSIASYRVPGSTIDLAAPSARYEDDLFLGSGSSQSAAVTSGLAALILQHRPELTPDQLKATINRNAEDKGDPDYLDGNGLLSGNKADKELDIAGAEQKYVPAAGRGTGIIAASGASWSGGGWSGASWSGASWSGATWSGASWSGASWSGASWSGASWSGASWSGASWSGASWSGASWSGASWSGASWSGSGWS